MIAKLSQYSLEKNDFEIARKLVEMTIRKCPRETAATGWDHLKRAELYEAIESYSELAELRYRQATQKIGDLYLQKGDVEQAVAAYQRVLRAAGGRSFAPTAVQELEELGVLVPTHSGYDTKAVLTRYGGHMLWGEKGYWP